MALPVERVHIALQHVQQAREALRLRPGDPLGVPWLVVALARLEDAEAVLIQEEQRVAA